MDYMQFLDLESLNIKDMRPTRDRYTSESIAMSDVVSCNASKLQILPAAIEQMQSMGVRM